MPKSLKILLILAVLLVVILIFQNRQPDDSSKILKIGAILPLTGGYASVAEEINRGALIAVNEAMSQGTNLKYIPIDDEFTRTGMVNAANKLTRFDKVDAALTPTVTEVKPVAPIFNEAKIPLLAVWDSNEYIKTAGDYIFTIGFATEANGQKMAEYAYKNLRLKKVAVISHIEDWSNLIADSFENEFKDLGGEVMLRENFQLTEVDFRTVLGKIKQLNAEGIYFPLNPPGNSRLLTQAKQLGLDTIMLTGDGFIQEEIDTAGETAENVYQTHLISDNLNELIKTYENQYHQPPYAPDFVSFGYDAIKVLLRAKQIATDKDLSFQDALTQVDMQTTGSYVRFNGKRYSDRIEKLFKIINGEPQLLE